MSVVAVAMREPGLAVLAAKARGVLARVGWAAFHVRRTRTAALPLNPRPGFTVRCVLWDRSGCTPCVGTLSCAEVVICNLRQGVHAGDLATMKQTDDRLPELSHGVGVVSGDNARFYPFEQMRAGAIEETFAGRPLRVWLDPDAAMPCAQWTDTQETPLSLFTRWYGLVSTYPGCEVAGNGAP